MRLTIPDFALVVLVAAPGAGAAFAARHFDADEVLTADSADAAAERLAARRLTVIDAAIPGAEERKRWIKLARRCHAPPVALALDLRDAARRHVQALRQALPGLERDRFGDVHVLAAVEDVEVVREPLACDRRGERGPFDIIGDVHGCHDELVALLARLGYGEGDGAWRHPQGRRVVFVGDLVDRGPRIPAVLRLAMAMVAAGSALCVASNHDAKLARKLAGRDVAVAHGLAETLAQLDALPDAERAPFIAAAKRFLDTRPTHLWLDDGKLVVAHGGLRQDMHGRDSAALRAFCLYGDTTGETDASGAPVRRRWAADYRGPACVVYGHAVVARAEWLNDTIDIDTGCVFGGSLTALRYPERTLVAVPGARVYWRTH